VLANHAARRRRGQNTVTAQQHAPESVRCRYAQDDLDRTVIVVAAVAAHDQGLPGVSFERVENGLDKVLEVGRLLEQGHFLAQPGGARALPIKWFGRDSFKPIHNS
jgi:hypothetical protein